MDRFAQMSDLEYESDNEYEDDETGIEKEKPPILIRDQAHGHLIINPKYKLKSAKGKKASVMNLAFPPSLQESSTNDPETEVQLFKTP
jgi:hypothetical protein